MKEYNLDEVLKMKSGTVLKIYPFDKYERKMVVSEGVAGVKHLFYLDDDNCQQEKVGIDSWIMYKATFIIQK